MLPGHFANAHHAYCVRWQVLVVFVAVFWFIIHTVTRAGWWAVTGLGRHWIMSLQQRLTKTHISLSDSVTTQLFDNYLDTAFSLVYMYVCACACVCVTWKWGCVRMRVSSAAVLERCVKGSRSLRISCRSSTLFSLTGDRRSSFRLTSCSWHTHPHNNLISMRLYRHAHTNTCTNSLLVIKV